METSHRYEPSACKFFLGVFKYPATNNRLYILAGSSANDYKKLQAAISEYMDKSISFYDGGAEGFYHGLMLGLIALMDNQYKIKSNRESGDGRYDISLIPRENRYPGIILELKWKNGLSADSLDTFANEALTQIDNMRYDSEMKQEGIKP